MSGIGGNAYQTGAHSGGPSGIPPPSSSSSGQAPAQYQQYTAPTAQPAQTTLRGPLPTPPSQTQSHHLPSPLPLDLGFLPAASSSQTSLLEAVVGPTARQAPRAAQPTQPIPARAPSAYPYAQSAARTRVGVASGYASAASSQPGSRDHSGSEGSRSFGTSTEREWDVLSDKSLKLNEGDDPEAVEELQKKVNKRRSNLPHLENELAALEAQIKAAEERIARAQSSGQKV